MSCRKHLRRLAWLAKYSKLFADHAALPYGLGLRARFPRYRPRRASQDPLFSALRKALLGV
jgi:hypothetical protein